MAGKDTDFTLVTDLVDTDIIAGVRAPDGAATNIAVTTKNLGKYIRSLGPTYTVNDIGVMGGPGAGVGICPGPLPAGMAPIVGTTELGHDNYGNYMYTLEDLIREGKPAPSPLALSRQGNGDLETHVLQGVAPP